MFLPLLPELLVFDLSPVSLHNSIEVFHSEAPLLVVSQYIVDFRMAGFQTVEPSQNTRDKYDLPSWSYEVPVQQLFSEAPRSVVVGIHDSFDNLLGDIITRVYPCIVDEYLEWTDSLKIFDNSSHTVLFGEVELHDLHIKVVPLRDVSETLQCRPPSLYVSCGHYQRR